MSKINVYCVHLCVLKNTPLALGYLITTLKHYHPEIANNLNFSWIRNPKMVKDRSWIQNFSEPSIFLMSDYPWNVRAHLLFSKALKAINPKHVIIHGGPYIPYNNSSFLQNNLYVDFTVHHEGELTFAELILQIFTDKNYQQVKGISYRCGEKIIMTEAREGMTDLTIIPSPYLTGEFETLFPELDFAVIETNRGCPYKCAYCSWPFFSSKIIKQDLNRVYEELEWMGKNKIKTIFFADSNFGILDRDIKIAEYLCSVKNRYDYPENVIIQYSSKTNECMEISRLLISSKIITNLVLSIQTMDKQTLFNIKRKPISEEYCKSVQNEYVKNRLPVTVQLMIGLPGSTYESFKRDIDYVVDEKMFPAIFPTRILPNSKLNEPDYRKEHGIISDIIITEESEGEFIVAANSFTHDEYKKIYMLSTFVNFAICYRTLKYITYFAATEKQINQSDVLEFFIKLSDSSSILSNIIQIIKTEVDDFLERKKFRDVREIAKNAYLTIETQNQWDDFYQEIKDILHKHYNIDKELIETVIHVQKRILPSKFNPQTPIQLDYDFSAYYFQDKPKQSLKTFASKAVFAVKDPTKLCADVELVNKSFRDMLNYFELNSPLWKIE
ncbi:MAG: radical SAM protein [Desulfobacterales bacterium]|nr:radical SAM protein [Desulfobacterales bacterium]